MKEPSADHLVFRSVGVPDAPEPELPDGYRLELWEPSLLRMTPPGAPRLTYSAWWLFDRGRVFHNGSYGVVLAWRGRELAHRLGIFPGWFRFPFMGRDDLQMGDLWTAPDHRGRGLATCALRFAMHVRAGACARAFWYLTQESNSVSARTARRAGLALVGRAPRTRRWGLRSLGRFELEGG